MGIRMSDHYGDAWAANMSRKYKKDQLVGMVRRAFLMFEALHGSKRMDEVDEIAAGFAAMRDKVAESKGGKG